MEKKNRYVAPAITVVAVECENHLLAASGEPESMGIYKEYASESDPVMSKGPGSIWDSWGDSGE